MMANGHRAILALPYQPNSCNQDQPLVSRRMAPHSERKEDQCSENQHVAKGSCVKRLRIGT